MGVGLKLLLGFSFLFFSSNIVLAQDYHEKFIANIEECLTETPTVIPHDLIIAQGALESDWGRSRFATEGNALFGIRTYDLFLPHMKPLERPDANFGVKKYDSICESVYDYLDLLENSYHYESFQMVLKVSRNPIVLASTLTKYSENKNYANLLTEVINEL